MLCFDKNREEEGHWTTEKLKDSEVYGEKYPYFKNFDDGYINVCYSILCLFCIFEIFNKKEKEKRHGKEYSENRHPNFNGHYL